MRAQYRHLYRHRTVADYAAERAERCPEGVAIHLEEGVDLTFGALWRDALALLGAFSELGLRPGDVVSFQLPNWKEAVVVDLACAAGGLVVNPIIPIYREREMEFILGDCRARLLVVPERFRGWDYAAMAAALRPRLPHLEHLVVVRGASAGGAGFWRYEELLAGAVPGSPRRVDPDELKILLYTSGTTGHPKAVRHSHNTFTRAFDNGAEAWELGAGDVMLMPSPVTHITGFANGIELPFLSEARAAFMERWDAERALEFALRVGATACLSATPFLKELLDVCEARGEGLPSLRFFASGGAAVPPALIYRAHRVFARARAFRVYGSTEAPLVTVGFMDPADERLAAETDGRPYNWEVRIVDDEERPLPPGADGEILVRGPALMLGYGDPQQTRAALTADGFFRTGDVGHLTAEGALVVTDRKKDIIIRGGENLSAREIEEVLLGHPAIRQVAVVAMPHPRLGEGVCACAVLEPGARLELSELRPFLEEAKLARQKWPERLEVLDELPTTASGKVRKDLLRDWVRRRVAGP
ncbi:MAG: cyclohexanecarboxylate-CoA ligase [Porticoccaceae bacterium]|nr:MAG: cyclohexanecarboxylate-CoA ligase [Porticoccaceae bacterium]